MGVREVHITQLKGFWINVYILKNDIEYRAITCKNVVYKKGDKKMSQQSTHDNLTERMEELRIRVAGRNVTSSDRNAFLRLQQLLELTGPSGYQKRGFPDGPTL